MKLSVISHIDKISKKGEEYSRVKEVSVQRCVDDYKKMLKQKRTYEKRPNGLVLTVYADDGHIESRRTFKRLSSEEAKGVKSGYDRDYEYALKYYNYSRHDGGLSHLALIHLPSKQLFSIENHSLTFY